MMMIVIAQKKFIFYLDFTLACRKDVYERIPVKKKCASMQCDYVSSTDPILSSGKKAADRVNFHDSFKIRVL
jgi:hypothetical protein